MLAPSIGKLKTKYGHMTKYVRCMNIYTQTSPTEKTLDTYFPKQLLAVGVLAVLVRAWGEVSHKRRAVSPPVSPNIFVRRRDNV